MNDDVRRLLGGYATGTLTQAEQKELYEAALRDDLLFAALADEQALRDLLADPASRQRLLVKLNRKKQPTWSVPVAIAAMLVITVGAGMLWLRLNPPTQEVAMSVPRPAVSEPARPEAERQQPRQFKPEERKAVPSAPPRIPPPPSAIQVSSQAPKIAAPPAAALEIKQEAKQLAAPVAAEKTADLAAKVHYRFIESSEGLRVALTSTENGQLVVNSRAGRQTKLIFSTAAVPQTEYVVPSEGALPDNVSELIVTLDKTVFASRFAKPQAPAAARSAIRAEADQAAGSPYVLHIPIPKKD